MDPRQAENALTVGLKKLAEAEADITRYDTVVGDGDCGIGLKRGAEGELSDPLLPVVGIEYIHSYTGASPHNRCL